MKTKKFFYILLVLSVVCTFYSCRRKQRLVYGARGGWKIWGFYINGKNATDSLNFIYRIVFTPANYGQGGLYDNRCSIESDSGFWIGSYTFDKRNLVLSGGYYSTQIFPYTFRSLMKKESDGSITFKVKKSFKVKKCIDDFRKKRGGK